MDFSPCVCVCPSDHQISHYKSQLPRRETEDILKLAARRRSSTSSTSFVVIGTSFKLRRRSGCCWGCPCPFFKIPTTGDGGFISFMDTTRVIPFFFIDVDDDVDDVDVVVNGDVNRANRRLVDSKISSRRCCAGVWEACLRRLD
jgi:hypothetical protein